VKNRAQPAVSAHRPATAEKSRSSHFATAVRLYVGVFAVIFLLEFLRRPGALLYPTLYFEDGVVFYRDQLLSASISTLFKPFNNGYYLLAPRLVAFLAYFLPARDVPYLFNVTGLGIGAAAAAVFCLPVFRQVLESDTLRVALCILFAIAIDNTEFLATPSNCFWLIGIPVILLAMLPPAVQSGAPTSRKKLRNGTFVLAGALLGLLTPLTVIVAPIAAWQIYRNRQSNRWQLPTGYLLATVVQVAVYLTIGVPAGQEGPSLQALITAFLVAAAHRVVMSPILGLHWSISLMAQRVAWVPLLGLALLEGVGLYLFFRGSRLVRLKTALCLYILGANLLLSLTGKGLVPQFQQIGGDVLYGGPRYFFLSGCAFALLVALAIEQCANGLFRSLGARSRAPWAKELAMGLLLAATFSPGLIANFHCENGVDFHWTGYGPLIDSWKQTTARGLPVARAVVPINLPGWAIRLPASSLTNGGFEEETLGPWAIMGAAHTIVSTAQHHGGQKSLLVEGAGGAFADLWTGKQGRKHMVTAWVRSDCSKPASGSIWIHDGATHQASVTKQVGCDWERVSLEFTSTDFHVMRIHLVNDSSGALYWDDVMISTER
jgi:hypothetical protein